LGAADGDPVWLRPSAARPRWAIYTRKSTEEGLDQEFNTLDAQRESAEAYIKSQAHEGWQCLADRYDDGGFSGGNMDRPALRRLMADIEAGKVDCVVVYKVDRLSRSLLDFARMMEAFERHNISFVSVTQLFNTSTPMGRLMLNVLLSFAQFEREIISERTRDKIAATRRKGQWSGGRPLLGYDVVETKLVVNALEAQRVREIFELYLEHKGLVPVVEDLNRRDWTTKQWTTRKGERRGGRPFTKNALYQLLTNVTYAGKVRYKREVHEGKHTAIVDAEVFRRVQLSLEGNGRRGGTGVRNKHGALLCGLLRCGPCGCSMRHTFSVKGNRRYRYYVCAKAQQHGWKACPAPSLPAGEIEQFVVERIKVIGHDSKVIRQTVAVARRQVEDEIEKLAAQRVELEKQVRADRGEMGRVGASGSIGKEEVARLADLQQRIQLAETRLAEIGQEIAAIGSLRITERDVGKALAHFAPLWQSLSPREQAELIALLVERVEYDGKEGAVSITFHPTGIQALAQRAIEESDE
jgi:site-specific DNA recombinase